MELDAGICRLRPFRSNDRERLAELGDDRRIWRNLTDRFPHPYTAEHADTWIALCAGEHPPRNFAIEMEGELVGAVGVELLDGVREGVGYVGYWVGVDCWGRGVATSALRALSEYAFDEFGLRRLEASVFGWNPASSRVLAKCGYQLEGRLEAAIIKDGEVTDELRYGLTRPEPMTPATGGHPNHPDS